MDVPIVSFLENYTLEELIQVLTKYGVCTDFVVEGNNNLTNKNRIFVGSVTAIYKPKIRSQHKSLSYYTLNAVNLITKNNEKGTPVRIVLIGNIVRKLAEAKVKKNDVIAILNPKFFFVNYSNSKLPTLTTGPLNVILWLCRNIKICDKELNSSPKKIANDRRNGTASCQRTSLSDDTEPDADCNSVSSKQICDKDLNSSPKKIANDRRNGAASCQRTSLSDDTEPDADRNSVSSKQQVYTTRVKTPVKRINQGENSSTCGIDIDSDDSSADPDYCPSSPSNPPTVYKTRAKTSPKKKIDQRANTSTSVLHIDSDDTDADPDYCPSESPNSMVRKTRAIPPPKLIDRRVSSSTSGLQFGSDDTNADPDYCPSSSLDPTEPFEERTHGNSGKSISSDTSESIESAMSRSIGRNNDVYRSVPVNLEDNNSQRSLPQSNSSFVINKKTFTKNIPKRAPTLNKVSNNLPNNTSTGCVEVAPNKSNTTVINENSGVRDKGDLNKTLSSPHRKRQNSIHISNCLHQRKGNCNGESNSPSKRFLCSKEKLHHNQSMIRHPCSPSKFSHGCSHCPSRCTPFSCCLHGPFFCRPEPSYCSCIPSCNFQHHSHCNSCDYNCRNRPHNCCQRSCDPSPCSFDRLTNNGIVDNSNNVLNGNVSNKSCGRFVCQRMKPCVNDSCRFCQPEQATSCCNFHKLPETGCHRSTFNCVCNCRNSCLPCNRHAKQNAPNREKSNPPIEADGVDRIRDWVMNCDPPHHPIIADVLSQSSVCDSSINSLQIQEKVIPQVMSNQAFTFLGGNSPPKCNRKRLLFNPAESPAISVMNAVILTEESTPLEKSTPDNLVVQPDLLSKGTCIEESEDPQSNNNSQIVDGNKPEKLKETQSSNPEKKNGDQCIDSNPGPSNEQKLSINYEVSASEPEIENQLSVTQEIEKNNDNCDSTAIPPSTLLADAVDECQNSVNNDLSNKLIDSSTQNKRKNDESSELSKETQLDPKAALKKRKTTSTDPASDNESIKSIETINLDANDSDLRKETNLRLSKPSSSQAPVNRSLAVSPVSGVSSAETFHDAQSTTPDLTQRFRTSPENQWLMKPIEEINDYSSIASKFSKLNVILPLKEPMHFRLYSPLSTQGIIINMIPPPDNLGALIMGICHDRCKRSYEYKLFEKMEKIDFPACTSCKHRLHYACSICHEAGFKNPLCLYFSFDIHLYVNDSVLRLEVEYQDAVEFLDCTPAAYIRCHDKICRKIQRIIFKEITNKESIIYLNATIKPKPKRGITALTLCNTSLAKHLLYKNSKYNYKANK